MAERGGYRPDTAIVLSGGGAFAAYEAGVMRAILGGETATTGYQRLDPGIITGTSAGALNAALMVSRLDLGVLQALDDLDFVWLEQLAAPVTGGGNGVFRFRLDPTSMFAPAFFSDPLHPFRNLVDDGLSLLQTLIRRGADFALSTGPVETRAVDFVDFAALISIDPLLKSLRRVIDLNALGQSKRSLRVAATNWSSGEIKVFSNRDMAGEAGYLAIQGSAAIPGLFPPVTIGSDTYVDGGVVINTPLKPAIDAGASELHVIYLDPLVDQIPTSRLEGTLEVFQRSLAIAFASTAKRDIETARIINEGIRISRAKTTARRPLSKSAVKATGELGYRETTPVRPLTIHRYLPSSDLGSGWSILDFSRNTIKTLIERGHYDGIRHDCAASQCVFP